MRTQTTARVWKKVVAALLALAMVLGAMPLSPAMAQEVAGDKTVACVGASGIAVPSGGWTKDAGSYVYYGKYDGNNPTMDPNVQFGRGIVHPALRPKNRAG